MDVTFAFLTPGVPNGASSRHFSSCQKEFITFQLAALLFYICLNTPCGIICVKPNVPETVVQEHEAVIPQRVC